MATTTSMETSSSSQSIDLLSLRSRVSKLTDVLRSFEDASGMCGSDSEKLLQDCVLDLDNKARKIVSEYFEVGGLKDDDLDAYEERLGEELRKVEAECADINEEIGSLTKSYIEGTCQLENDIEELNHSLDYVELKSLRGTKARNFIDSSSHGHAKSTERHVEFEILDLKHQIEKNRTTLKSLQDLDFTLKRFEAIKIIEEAFTGLSVIEYEGNYIRLSLRTYIPHGEGLMSSKLIKDITVPSDLDHELLLEIKDETMELKNVEIFPNDVYLGEIVEAAASFSNLHSALSGLRKRSPLGWFLQKVQDRIIMCTLRQLMAKIANKSRRSLEYLDRDEEIIAHMIGGVDAIIKPSHGWPVYDTPLKLVSLSSSDHSATKVSLTLLCKVEEVANSLDLDTRKNLTSFVDRIEEILVQKMRLELHP